MIVKYKLLTDTAKFFKQATAGSTGMDVYSDIDVTLNKGEFVAVGTGVSVDLTETPIGAELQIRPRSGLSSKGVVMLNAPGTIDRDYTGEIKVLMTNLGDKPYKINKGDRIAQAVFMVFIPNLTAFPVSELAATGRGSGGFGSTGN